MSSEDNQIQISSAIEKSNQIKTTGSSKGLDEAIARLSSGLEKGLKDGKLDLFLQ